MQNRRDSEDFKYRKNLNDKEVRKASKHRKPIDYMVSADDEVDSLDEFSQWWDANEAN